MMNQSQVGTVLYYLNPRVVKIAYARDLDRMPVDRCLSTFSQIASRLVRDGADAALANTQLTVAIENARGKPPTVEPARHQAKQVLTVGVALKQLIHNRYRIPTCGSCHAAAKKMDELGVDGCRAEIDDLSELLQSNATALNWEQLFAAVLSPRLSQLTGAVRSVTEGPAFYASLIEEACQMVEQQQPTIDSAH